MNEAQRMLSRCIDLVALRLDKEEMSFEAEVQLRLLLSELEMMIEGEQQ